MIKKLYPIECIEEWLLGQSKICRKNIKEAVDREKFDEAFALKIEAETYEFVADVLSNESELEYICEEKER